MEEITVFTYSLSLSRREWAKVSQARWATGELWSRLVKIHRFCRRRHWPWQAEGQLKVHFKKRLPLHSQTVQGIIEKFCATIDGVRTKRQNGDKTARYPHRLKRYFNPIFKGQALKIRDGNRLELPMGRGREPLRMCLPGLPEGRIVQAELGFGVLYLTAKKTVPDPQPAGTSGGAGLDVGVVHLGTVSDGEQTLAVSGRGLRSVKQGRAKAHGKLQKKLSRCQKGSRRWKKLKRAGYRITGQTKNIARNALHHAANQIVDFCQENRVSTLYTGDLGNINKNKRKKRSRRTNQEVGTWEFGLLQTYLRYKLARHGIQLAPISEAYTSQTCPICGHRTRVAGRTYRCRRCGYTAHRDAVGAVNILNKGVHQGVIQPGILPATERVTYRRPVPVKGASRRSCA